MFSFVKDQSCKFKQNSVGATITGYYSSQNKNEVEMTQALDSVGPLSIVLNADILQSYSSGIVNTRCSKDVNHAVLAVGYGTDAKGLDYYIVKNSWGSAWGKLTFLE